MNKWEVWLAEYAFEDKPTQYKIRPVLIINNTIHSTLVAKITKHPPREQYFGEYKIKKWSVAGLDKPSTVRLSKLLFLCKTDFKNKLGRLHPTDIKEIQNAIKKSIRS